MKKTLAVGIAALALMAAASAQAQWSSFWVESSAAGIDRVTGTISGGGSFNTPGFEAEFLNFPTWPTPLAGWGSANSGKTASMSDPGSAVTTDLYYWINFTSAITQPFQIDQKSWNGSTLVDETIISYDGSGTILPVGSLIPGTDIEILDHPFNNDGFRTDLPLATPDGGSDLMLLGSTLAGLACLRRRFVRR